MHQIQTKGLSQAKPYVVSDVRRAAEPMDIAVDLLLPDAFRSQTLCRGALFAQKLMLHLSRPGVEVLTASYGREPEVGTLTSRAIAATKHVLSRNERCVEQISEALMLSHLTKVGAQAQDRRVLIVITEGKDKETFFTDRLNFVAGACEVTVFMICLGSSPSALAVLKQRGLEICFHGPDDTFATIVAETMSRAVLGREQVWGANRLMI